MTRSSSWLLFLTTVFVTWEDSAENPAVFCYRMSWGIYLNLRSRALSPIPVSARHRAACWNTLATFFTPSTTPKGSSN
jgi:hypothetical protein